MRPRIFLPAGLRGPERAAVLRHERTHIARGDTVTKPLFYAIACLHWPNPLVWLAFAQFERTMECACDEAAVRGLVPERRRDYGESILRFAALPRGRAPGSLAFSRGRVKERVVRVLRYRRPGRLALLGCALTALLTAAACMVRPTVAAAVQPPVLRDVPAAPEATPAPAPTPTPAPAFTAPLTSYTRFTTPYDEQGHTGLDIAAPRGTPVYAAADGTVAESGYDNVGAQSRGNFVRILHTGAGDWSTLYAHLDSCAVAAGETVTAGQVIGYVGDSGYAFGEHLHFELLQNGVPVDPQAWVAFPAAE